MNTTQAQQKALDDALVAPADRLEFGKCNMRLKTDIKPKEATFQVVLDALALTPFYQAFLITVEVENKDTKKTNKMLYSRFTKVIIDYFMSKDQSISIRNKMFWHTARGDIMFTSMRCVSRHEKTQTYYVYAIGEKTLKEKYVRKKAESNTSPKKKTAPTSKGSRLKSSAKAAKTDKKKQPATMPKTKGLAVLSEVALTEAKQIKLATKRSKKDFHIQDDEDDVKESDLKDDSEETESDNDGDNITHSNLSTYKADNQEEEKEKADDEEVSSDQRVSTPPDYELTDEEENKEGDDKDKEGEHEQDEEDDLYRDVNVNLERSDTKMTDAQAKKNIEDAHVTLTTEPPIVQQQSSFVSSDLVSKFINLSPDTGIRMETEMSEFKQTKQFVEDVSSILGIVDNYLASKMKETVDVVVQLQTNKLREEAQAENHEFLNQVDSTMKAIIKEQVQAQVSKIMSKIEKYVTEYLEAEVLVRSTNQPQTSYAVAASLLEFELKKILIDKMETNKSNDRKSAHAEEHVQEVDDLEDQSLQEFNTGNDDETLVQEAPDDDESQWNPSSSPAPDLELEYHLEEVFKATNDRLDLHNPEGKPYPHDLSKPFPLILNERGRQVILLDHFINNDLEYLTGGSSSQKYTTSITKTKAADYGQVKWIEDKLPEKINLTKPNTYRSDIKRMTPYTAYPNIQGIIYEDEMNRNRLMRTYELHKFSDGTLNHVRTALNDIDRGIEMDYLPKRK
ncbi:hypothetical protein Tco_0838121 [Tanacetum coccineum]|uniref:Uncharacterized protein n=1 Tax=Tanacetum coccineum TaxID=301880 RepID=A0ABQ5ARJ3_9ASTR